MLRVSTEKEEMGKWVREGRIVLLKHLNSPNASRETDITVRGCLQARDGSTNFLSSNIDVSRKMTGETSHLCRMI